MFKELNFLDKKRLPFCSCNPNRNSLSQFLDVSRQSLDLYSAKSENLMMIGDCNAELSQTDIKDFCKSYKLNNLTILIS